MRPSTGDIRRIHAVCADACDLRWDPERQHQAVVDGLCRLVGADRGFSAVSELSSDGGTPCIEHCGGFGGDFAWDLLDRESFQFACASGRLASDPCFGRAAELAASHRTVIAGSGRRWLEASRWDQAIRAGEAFGIGGVGDVAIAVFCGHDWQGKRTRAFGVALHRMSRGRDIPPFQTKELVLLGLFAKLRRDDYLAGRLGALADGSESPVDISLSDIEREAYSLYMRGLSHESIASTLSADTRFSRSISRAGIGRLLAGVAQKLCGKHHCRYLMELLPTQNSSYRQVQSAARQHTGIHGE